MLAYQMLSIGDYCLYGWVISRVGDYCLTTVGLDPMIKHRLLAPYIPSGCAALVSSQLCCVANHCAPCSY